MGTVSKIKKLWFIKKAMPDFRTWLKLMKLFLLITFSGGRWRWRRGRILVITFGSDHIIFARYLSRIRSGTREKEHIQNNGHQGQKHFFHFYEILNWTKRWPSGIFRSAGAFQPPVSFGVLLCYFWKVETVSDPLGYFPMDLSGRITASHKNELSRKAMLATHSGIHFLQQSKLKCSIALQTAVGLVLDIF